MMYGTRIRELRTKQHNILPILIKPIVMIPILEPAQIPDIFFYAFILMLMFGIPTALVTLVCFFVIEHVPSPRARLILPAAGAVLMLAINLAYFSGPQLENEYQQKWAMMMITGFLSTALLILAPFPFIRQYTARNSPYLVIAVSALVTIFLLTCLGLFGGETKMPLDTAEYQWENIMSAVAVAVAEIVIAALCYCCIAVLGKKVYGNPEQGD